MYVLGRSYDLASESGNSFTKSHFSFDFWLFFNKTFNFENFSLKCERREEHDSWNLQIIFMVYSFNSLTYLLFVLAYCKFLIITKKSFYIGNCFTQNNWHIAQLYFNFPHFFIKLLLKKW